jgi:hypothetical protein
MHVCWLSSLAGRIMAIAAESQRRLMYRSDRYSPLVRCSLRLGLDGPETMSEVKVLEAPHRLTAVEADLNLYSRITAEKRLPGASKNLIEWRQTNYITLELRPATLKCFIWISNNILIGAAPIVRNFSPPTLFILSDSLK